MIIFSPQITPRLVYMANWLGNYLFGEPMRVIDEINSIQSDCPVINYSHEPLNFPNWQIPPAGLLAGTSIRPLNVVVLPKNDNHLVFPGDDRPGFDLLSAVFYLLSRYEEYLPYTNDEYGRYAHTNSIAFKNGFLDRPVIDEWMSDMTQNLKTVFPCLVFRERNFQFTPTYDIDIAWSYKNKGWLRMAGGFFKDILKGNWLNGKERLNVWAGNKQDPFEIYDELDQLHEKYNLRPHYFILLAQKITAYDKSIAPANTNYRSLIAKISSRNSTGIHISWQASFSIKTMQKEIKKFEEINGKKPESNRMHYINFHLPETFQKLLSNGITKEYSMGYGSINGFRAGTCSPFNWYDLSTETETQLEIYPYCYMEANSIFEQKVSADEALEELQHYHDLIKHCGGLLVTIFHNHLVGMDKKGRAWMNMYQTFLQRNFSEQH